jgi:D-alanine-D-alanine ligase
MNIMAGFQGMRYSELLGQILQAAIERLAITARPAPLPNAVASGNGHAVVAAE